MKKSEKKMLHDIIYQITDGKVFYCGERHGDSVVGTRLTKEEYAFIEPIIGAWHDESFKIGKVTLRRDGPICYSLMDIGDGFYYIYLHDKAEACRALRAIESQLVYLNVKYDDLIEEEDDADEIN